MLLANQLKPGVAVIVDGRALMVESATVAGTAQRRRTYHVRMRDILTGQNLERSFGETDKFEEPELERRNAQLSYRKGREWVFLDEEDYGERVLTDEQIERAKKFLKEGETYRLLVLDGRPVGVELPPSVTLGITETAAPLHGAQGSSALKEATLENGLIVRVPPFLKAGDRIKVSTETLEYLGKA
jgi:elongation factor P